MFGKKKNSTPTTAQLNAALYGTTQNLMAGTAQMLAQANRTASTAR